LAATWKKLAFSDDVILKTLLTATGDIIYASAPATPAALPIGTDEYVLQVATNVPAWVDPTTLPVGSHALDDHTAADGAVDFNDQEATDMVLCTVANTAGRPASPPLGQIIWQTDELSAYICTVVA
jgi:hypothetical protein